MLTSQILARYEEAKNFQNYFNLKKQLQEISKPDTPGSPSPIKKPQVQMHTQSTFLQQIQTLREAILVNLLLNSEFKSRRIRVKEFENFFTMLKITSNQPDENLMAKHILALHISKSQFASKLFVNYLDKCSSVTVNGFNPEFLRNLTGLGIDVENFFQSVVNNPKIAIKIEQLVSNISLKPLTLHCKDVELKLFESSVPGLRGFSGDGVVYVSINWIEDLHESCLEHKRIACDTATILQLELVRIFTHEIVHVLLRRAIADMNESTPELLKLKPHNKALIAEEAGICIEIQLFGAKIDFEKTVSLASFDGPYFSQLLRDIIDGNFFSLDLDKVVIVEPSNFPKMDLDIDPPKGYILDI